MLHHSEYSGLKIKTKFTKTFQGTLLVVSVHAEMSLPTALVPESVDIDELYCILDLLCLSLSLTHWRSIRDKTRGYSDKNQ